MSTPCHTACILARSLQATNTKKDNRGGSEAIIMFDAVSGSVLYKNDAAKLMLSNTKSGNIKTGQGHISSYINLLSGETDTCLEDAITNIATGDTKMETPERVIVAERTNVVMLENNHAPSAEPVSVRLAQLGACHCGCESFFASMHISLQIETDMKQRHLDHIRAVAADTAFDPMFSINERGIILLANQAASKQLGYSHEEFIGKNISMICGGAHAAKHDSYMKRYLDTGVARIIGKRRDVPARRKDGSEYLVELGITEIKVPKEESTCRQNNSNNIVSDDEEEEERIFCAYLRDRSAEIERDRKVKHHQRLTQGMIDASMDPMIQIDEDGTIQLVNNSACELFGYSQEEFIGCNVGLICGGKHHGVQTHNKYMDRYLRTGEKRIIGRKREATARRKDGSEFPIELGVAEVDMVEDGVQRKVFCGYIRDLTRQKLDQERMRKNEAIMQDGFFSGAASGTCPAGHVPRRLRGK